MTLPMPLRRSRVLELLGNARFARDLRVLGVVSSTSDLLLDQLGRGAEDGAVLVAESQTEGRGRRGTSWVSPSRKGLWFSVLLSRPEECRSPLLSAALGVAMARAVGTLDVDVAIKWPNDLLVGGAKVGGCLVDLRSTEATPHAVAGIGINANLGRGDLPSGSHLPASSLLLSLGRPIDRERLLATTLRELECTLEELVTDEDAVVSAYRDHDALPGARVVARIEDRTVEGSVVHADPRAGLLLRRSDGTEERLRPEHTHLLRVDLAP